MSSLPPIYCLTLAETPWKTEFVRDYLKGLRIEAVFVTGFYGPTLGLEPICECQRAPDGDLTFAHVNQVACALTHLCALKMALASGHTEWIVLEDDVILTDNFEARWKALRERVPDDCQQVLLENVHNNPAIEAAPGLQRVVPPPFGCSGIWWTRAAAMTACANLVPLRFPYDIGLIHRVYPFTNPLVAHPEMVRQRTVEESWPSSISKW